MSEIRKARIHGIFGGTNSGKSYYVLERLIPHYQKFHPHLRQVVITSENHPDYAAKGYEFITADQIPYWKNPKPGSVKRILINPADMDHIDHVFMQMNNHLPDAVVYAEDSGGYLPANLRNTPGVIAFIGSAKNQNREAYFQFWAFSEIPNRMCGWFKSMVIFPVRDVNWDPDEKRIEWNSFVRSKLGSNYYLVKKPYEKVLKLKMEAERLQLPHTDPRAHPYEIVFVN